MTKFPYYELEITKGRFVEGGMKTETKEFHDNDLKKARHDALKYCWEILKVSSSSIDDKKLAAETPVLIPMLDTFSASVSFVESENRSHLIYGEPIHETLTDLTGEAHYYIRNGLILKDELIKVLQNREDDDEEHLDYVLASSVTEMPEFEYDVIEVLPYELNEILALTPK